jgi:hypothetical protein
VDERRGVDELDHGRVEHAQVARVSAETRGHEEHGRANALAAAHLDVLPHLGDELDPRFEMSRELAFEVIETFGRDVLGDFDTDPVHRTTRLREAQIA